jgi:hypothetical protein
MRFKHSAAVWRNKETGTTFAFPLVYENDWGVEGAYPLIDEQTWEFRGVLPAATSVGPPRVEQGHRVSVVLGATRLHTADWNLVSDADWAAAHTPATLPTPSVSAAKAPAKPAGSAARRKQ